MTVWSAINGVLDGFYDRIHQFRVIGIHNLANLGNTLLADLQNQKYPTDKDTLFLELLGGIDLAA